MIEKLTSAAATAAVIIVVSLAIIAMNTLARQHEQFRRGEEAYAARDFTRAVAGYESAIHMYTPGSGTVEKAAARLWELGEAAQLAGERERALMAYRALRSSFYATAWLVTPGEAWIAKADDRIRILESTPGPSPAPGR